jgi:hypothetical protein
MRAKITPTGIANNLFRMNMMTGVKPPPGVGTHHKILFTATILERFAPLGISEVDLVRAIRDFKDEDFHTDFDPYGDRDMIVVEVEGIKVWGRIDHYDLDCFCLSPDPSNDAVTCRVLTIMLPEDY